MNVKAKHLFATLLLVSGIWFYFTPHMAVSKMKSAAEARDADKLSEYVNYPELKESLKTGLNTKLSAEVSKVKADPFGAMGAAVAAIFMDPLIDALVSPEGLALMMKGDASHAIKGDAKSELSDADIETLMSYESFDRFVMTVVNKDGVEEPVHLVFDRSGLFAWKLSGVRFP